MMASIDLRVTVARELAEPTREGPLLPVMLPFSFYKITSSSHTTEKQSHWWDYYYQSSWGAEVSIKVVLGDGEFNSLPLTLSLPGIHLRDVIVLLGNICHLKKQKMEIVFITSFLVLIGGVFRRHPKLRRGCQRIKHMIEEALTPLIYIPVG